MTVPSGFWPMLVVVHLNFSPSAGHEMADRHCALVLSPASYNRKSGMAIVCAITSRVRGGPFEVEPLGVGNASGRHEQRFGDQLVGAPFAFADVHAREPVVP